MAATKQYPIIPKEVLDRAHKMHSEGMPWLDAANANGIGYTAMMNQLRKNGYDMSVKHKPIRGKAKPEPGSAGWNPVAANDWLRRPLMGVSA